MIHIHDAIRDHLINPVTRQRVAEHRQKLTRLAHLLSEDVLTEKEKGEDELATKSKLWED